MANSTAHLTDLEKCGIATSNNLRELLTTCPDPVEGIRHFQQMNSVQLPSLNPVMKLLDLHGIRRTEYHEAVISELTDRTVARLRELGERQTPESVNKLEQHLERCFRLYRVPRIRPIVLETLAQLPKVADRYLKLIICDKELYDQCAVSVRQQIWVKNESLFLESVEPVLDSYIYDKHLLSLRTVMSEPVDSKDKQPQQPQPSTNFFTSDTAKSRRQKRQVQELISMIGQQEQLYCRLQDLVRERFLATGDVHYCSLRFDLLMAAHDVSMDFLARVDRCHDFAWCLDACSKQLRTKHIDAQQLAKLKTLLDVGGGGGGRKTGSQAQQQQQSKQQSKVHPEMAMIAGCPHILHLVASFAVKMLRDNAANSTSGHLPREMSSLQVLVKLLQMGLHARQLLTGQMTIQQLMEPELFTVFLAAFSSMLCRDVIHAELAQAPEEVVARLGWPAEERSNRHPSVDRFLRTEPLCALLWLHHLVLVGNDLCPLISLKRRPLDPANAFAYAEPLPWMANQLAISDPWIQLLAQKLHQCPMAFSNEKLATLFIRRFFIPNLQKVPSAKFHLLRLCVQHRHLIPAPLFCAAYKVLEKCSSAVEAMESSSSGAGHEEEDHPALVGSGRFATEFAKFEAEFAVKLEQQQKRTTALEQERRKKHREEEDELLGEESVEEGELVEEDEEDA